MKGRFRCESLALSDLVDLVVDDENEPAADLNSTREWTYGTSSTTPKDAAGDRPATRNYESRSKQARNRDREAGKEAEDRCL
jgi:hypothetical protein